MPLKIGFNKTIVIKDEAKHTGGNTESKEQDDSMHKHLPVYEKVK